MRNDTQLRSAIDAIVEERDYQRKRWGVDGDKTRSPDEWTTILAIYTGKVAMESKSYQDGNFSRARFLKRVKQLAAIAAAILENADNSE